MIIVVLTSPLNPLLGKTKCVQKKYVMYTLPTHTLFVLFSFVKFMVNFQKCAYFTLADEPNLTKALASEAI